MYPIYNKFTHSRMQQQLPNQQQEFFSFDHSKMQFSMMSEPQEKEKQNMFIKESSFKYEESSKSINYPNVLDRSIQQVDISMIRHQNESPQLDRSVSLQNQIDCLSLPNLVTPQELQKIKEKIEILRRDQLGLQKALTAFNGMIQVTKENNEFMIKEVKNLSSKNQQQINSKIVQSPPSPINRQQLKHYDIKPNRKLTDEQKNANRIYKLCTMKREVLLYQDANQEYRIIADYGQNELEVQIITINPHQTNYTYGLRLSDKEDNKICKTIRIPFNQYIPKRFVTSASVFLIIFDTNSTNTAKEMTEIYSISIPLPMNHFLQQRFIYQNADSQSICKSLEKYLFIYEIQIKYGVVQQLKDLLHQIFPAQKQWFSLNNSKELLFLEIGKIQATVYQKQSTQKVVFRAGAKDKNSPCLIDLIEFVCFMFAS